MCSGVLLAYFCRAVVDGATSSLLVPEDNYRSATWTAQFGYDDYQHTSLEVRQEDYCQGALFTRGKSIPISGFLGLQQFREERRIHGLAFQAGHFKQYMKKFSMFQILLPSPRHEQT